MERPSEGGEGIEGIEEVGEQEEEENWINYQTPSTNFQIFFEITTRK